MEIRAVTDEDREFVMGLEHHVDDGGYVIWEGNQRIGIMVHCILWGTIPFMNLLYIRERYRGRGFGREAVLCWEKEMRDQGYRMVLVSTQVNEGAQHLYRKLGSVDCGGLVFHDTPFDQPMELFLRKVLGDKEG